MTFGAIGPLRVNDNLYIAGQISIKHRRNVHLLLKLIVKSL